MFSARMRFHQTACMRKKTALKSPPRDVRNLRRTVLILHKTTSLVPDGAANRHNLYAIVERLVGVAAIQPGKRGGSLARIRYRESFRSTLSS